ncbi:MAG: hypothetical protein KHZ65_05600 [Phocaeicola vulgatus]|nr:hypothetical protein [Phocaeicola vulgatus]
MELRGKKVDRYLRRNKLTVIGLPGYTNPRHSRLAKQYKEIPFEDVIFKETGFLPSGSCHMITVRVDGNVEVSFSADTDLSVIARRLIHICTCGSVRILSLCITVSVI